MEEFWNWVQSDGLRLLGDIIIPVAAILISTLIAVSVSRSDRRTALATARAEREAAADNDRRSRRLDAGGDVIKAIAAMVSVDPMGTPIQTHLAELRGRIAVYRAWIVPGDISGDWLALKHQQGMLLWLEAMQRVADAGGPTKISEDHLFALLDPPRAWAGGFIDTFSGWLSGHSDDEVLRREGATLLKLNATPEEP